MLVDTDLAGGERGCQSLLCAGRCTASPGLPCCCSWLPETHLCTSNVDQQNPAQPDSWQNDDSAEVNPSWPIGAIQYCAPLSLAAQTSRGSGS